MIGTRVVLTMTSYSRLPFFVLRLSFFVLRFFPWHRIFRLPCPFGSHLREAIHIHGHALSLLFGRHRLQKIDRLGKVLFDRGAGGLVIEALDFGVLIASRQHPDHFFS